MQETQLASQLAAQISDFIRAENTPKGTRLVERKLAEQLNVSRSPVRRALRLLEAEGVVGSSEGGGYMVLAPERARSHPKMPITSDDEVYFRIAEDRLNAVLPEKVSENALLRRYALTRGQLTKILRRIITEGWIERLPGHGWRFLPMLTSLPAYEDSYRFRIAIEPAAILEPSFVLNREALEECQAQQKRLVGGEIWTVSNANLFDLNSGLHERIIECSQNVFFIESLKRLNNLRRLIEYRQSLDRKHAIVRCREHIKLTELLLSGKREEASDLMFHHLSSVSREKVAPKRHVSTS